MIFQIYNKYQSSLLMNLLKQFPIIWNIPNLPKIIPRKTKMLFTEGCFRVCTEQRCYFLILNQYTNILDYWQDMKSSSSSSSGSLRLIRDIDGSTPSKDLFQMLIEESEGPAEESWHRVVAELNLSPRQLELPGCKCTKIDCLKMYCECFSKGKVCTERCQCHSCSNHLECGHLIYRAQQLANQRHPGTFKGVAPLAPLRRCTCKKSECRKNYCQCFRAGIKCSQECECTACRNDKPHQQHHHSNLYYPIPVEVHA